MVTPFISYNCPIHEPFAYQPFAYQQFLPLTKPKKETWKKKKKNGWAKEKCIQRSLSSFFDHNPGVN